MSTLTELDLPAIDGPHQLLLNRLLSHGGSLDLAWQDQRLLIGLAKSPFRLQPTLMIELMLGTHTFRLALEHRDWLGPDLSVQLANLPAPLAAALLTEALTPLSRALEQRSGEAVRLRVSPVPLPVQDPDHPIGPPVNSEQEPHLIWRPEDSEMTIHLVIQAGESAPERVLLCLSPTAADVLVQLMAQRDRHRETHWDCCPLVGRVRIGSLRVSQSHPTMWQAGDVLLLRQGASEELAWLSFGGSLHWRGRWQEQTFILEELMTDHRDREPDILVEDQDALLNDLESLDITLHFDIGVRRFSLGEIKAMRPGTGIDLGRDLTKPVTIRSGGTALAKGELIRIDNRLGVRLVEVIGHADC